MATTVAYVDDAVQGRFPGVCIRDGVLTGGRLSLSIDTGTAALGVGVSTLGLALLLVRSPGWLALACVVSGLAIWARCQAVPPVSVPCSEPARWRLSAARWRAGTALVLTGGLVALELSTLAGRAHDATWWAGLLAAACMVAASLAAVAGCRLAELRVRAALDPSRRWVILSNVSPEFARAVDARYPLVG